MTLMTRSYKDSGFTLLELSIVLVIITLITGSIMAGRSLIHNAELQSIITDVDRFKKAAVLFKTKYKELPGDFPAATGIWGTDSACPAAVNVVPKVATCNGNGDGFIVDANTLTPTGGTSANIYETVRAWQHLANAGLIEGNYSGAIASLTNRQLAGVSTPLSKLNQNTYDIFHVLPGSYTGAYQANYRHIIVYGRVYGVSIDNAPFSPGLSTTDARSIDEKIDDSYPGRGMVLSYTNAIVSTAECATTAISTTAEYYTSKTGLKCALIFLTGF
jgi:prepilin-type N-terminal cleavage/methylation domain-containing protein